MEILTNLLNQANAILTENFGELGPLLHRLEAQGIPPILIPAALEVSIP